MKRSIIVLAMAALALGGCSSKAKDGEAAKPAVAAKKGGKVEPHVNPWAKDDSAETPQLAAAPAKKKAGAKAAPPTNPWAKDPPPGSEPAPDAKPKKK